MSVSEVMAMQQEKMCDRIESASELLGMKWILMIVYYLMKGPVRFVTLEQSCQISGRLLSERLKMLEREGIVKRTIFAEVPVRVEYELTGKGYSLGPVLHEIAGWAYQWVELPEETDLEVNVTTKK